MHERQRAGQTIGRYETPVRLEAALASLQAHGDRARLIAGGTDLLLELARRERPGVDVLIDVTRLPGLSEIREEETGEIRIGALVTYNQILRSELVVRNALPLAQACLEVGSPQIRNQGTLAGALITARPAGDVAPALMALGARATLRSAEETRTVAVSELLRAAPRPNEMLVEITVPTLAESERGLFVKLRARRGQAVALTNLALVLRFSAGGSVERARLVCGNAGPHPIELAAAANALIGNPLSDETIASGAERTARDARPVDDVHASAAYRQRMLEVMTRRGLRSLRAGNERQCWPERPVTLAVRSAEPPAIGGTSHDSRTPIEARVNGQLLSAPMGDHFTLLAWLRDALDLTGTKDGCAEGACGACTVLLDGRAVLACLVPAARAHGADVRTVEGLGTHGGLHPLQQAFLDQSASQCGFCTPGFLMAGAALLEEHPSPGKEEIEDAYAGNLCRCTGYYAIRRALAQVAGSRAEDGDGHREV